MARTLESDDLLITKIAGKNYAYIKPEIGSFKATRTIEDVSVTGNINHKINPLALKNGPVYLENVDARDNRLGLVFTGDTDLRVYDYQFFNTVGTATNDRFAAAIKRDDDHNGSAEFLRVYADGMDVSATGKFNGSKNTDFFDNNNGRNADGGAVFFRDITAKNFYDAAFDAKSDVYIMNATISGTTTGLRVWNNDSIYIVNSEISGGPNSDLIKFTGNGGKIYYYNTTWNGKSRPDLSEITTWQVPKNQIQDVKLSNVIELKENPLPKFDPFFTVDDARYFVEVSVNGGAWRRVDVPNNGLLSEHVGDTLIELPNLGSGTYRLRAWTVEDGKTSATVVSQDFAVGAAGATAKGSTARGSTAKQSMIDTIEFETASRDAVEIAGKKGGRGVDLVGSGADEVFITTAGNDRVTTRGGEDLIVFDTREDIGDDVIVDFHRGRDKLLFTEFVDLGSDTTHRLDASGRFVLDDPELDANGGTIALGAALGRRYIHYSGETEDGLFVYEIWNRPWSEIPD